MKFLSFKTLMAVRFDGYCFVDEYYAYQPMNLTKPKKDYKNIGLNSFHTLTFSIFFLFLQKRQSQLRYFVLKKMWVLFALNLKIFN